MRLRCQHHDRHDRQDLGDLPEHRPPEHQSPVRRLDVGCRSQRRLGEEHHQDEEHRCEVHRPVPDEHQRHLDVGRHLGEGHGPCPG
jgi:hypothetical protein